MSVAGKLSLSDLDVRDKRVFLRVDFNVPLDNHGHITDDRRIRAAIPTIRWLKKRKAKSIVIASHFGRPRGVVVEDQRLEPCRKRLQELLDTRVDPLRDCIGPEVERTVKQARDSAVVLLENLRFHREEEAGDNTFAEKLASHCDVYVNDAFGAAHRAHASVSGIPWIIKRNGGKAVAGLLMEAELKHLGGLLISPKSPFVLVVGGAKSSDKLPVLKNLLSKVDAVLIGGAMAYTFLEARGIPIGDSRAERDQVVTALEILNLAQERRVDVRLPSDHVVASRLTPTIEGARWTETQAILDGTMGLDIGRKTAHEYGEVIAKAKTIFWNGPMGVFEEFPFFFGTDWVAKSIADATDRASGAISIVGGGDTAAAAEAAGVASRMTHVSTGGGAALEFLEGRELPGVAALSPAPAVTKRHGV